MMQVSGSRLTIKLSAVSKWTITTALVIELLFLTTGFAWLWQSFMLEGPASHSLGITTSLLAIFILVLATNTAVVFKDLSNLQRVIEVTPSYIQIIGPRGWSRQCDWCCLDRITRVRSCVYLHFSGSPPLELAYTRWLGLRRRELRKVFEIANKPYPQSWLCTLRVKQYDNTKGSS